MKRLLVCMSVLFMLILSVTTIANAHDTAATTISSTTITAGTSAFASAKTSGPTMANSVDQITLGTSVQINQIDGAQVVSMTRTSSAEANLVNTANATANLTNGNSNATAEQGNNLLNTATKNYRGRAQSATVVTTLKIVNPASGINTEGTSVATVRILKFPISAGVNTGNSSQIESAMTISQTANRAPVTTLKMMINNSATASAAETTTEATRSVQAPGQDLSANSEYSINASVAQMTDSITNQENTNSNDLVAGTNDIILTAGNIGANLPPTMTGNTPKNANTNAMTTRPATPIHKDITMGIAGAGLATMNFA